MKSIFEKKTAGFYLIPFAAAAALISMIRFLVWALNHNGMDAIIIAALAAGVVLDLYLIAKDNDFIVIIVVACYSIAAVKLLTNSVGSFVDAIQGIDMFGDSSQVGSILSISIMILVSVLASIIVAFLKRVKE